MFQLGSVLIIFTLAVMVLVPPVIALVAVCAPFFVVVVEAVDRCNREMKRMSNAAMGPVLSNVQVCNYLYRYAVCSCRTYALNPNLVNLNTSFNLTLAFN